MKKLKTPFRRAIMKCGPLSSTDRRLPEWQPFFRPIYDVQLTPDRNALTVPSEFFKPGTVYKLEIPVLETTGNQTFSVGFIETE